MKSNKHPVSRARKWAIVCVMGIVLLASFAVSAYAQSQATNDSPAQYARNSTVTMPCGRNVYLAGGSVRLPTAVDGDFVAAGGSVLVDQAVKGDLTLAGGSINVRAPVGEDVRAAGGDVNIENTINGELFAVAGNITLTEAARVAHAATLYAGNVTLDGKIDGPLKVGAQKVTIIVAGSHARRLVVYHSIRHPAGHSGIDAVSRAIDGRLHRRGYSYFATYANCISQRHRQRIRHHYGLFCTGFIADRTDRTSAVYWANSPYRYHPHWHRRLRAKNQSTAQSGRRHGTIRTAQFRSAGRLVISAAP
jgi:hypothetical protein